jgi:hypothetical protein
LRICKVLFFFDGRGIGKGGYIQKSNKYGKENWRNEGQQQRWMWKREKVASAFSDLGDFWIHGGDLGTVGYPENHRQNADAARGGGACGGIGLGG